MLSSTITKPVILAMAMSIGMSETLACPEGQACEEEKSQPGLYLVQKQAWQVLSADSSTREAEASSFTVMSGPCEAVGLCVQSPNYPDNFGLDEECSINVRVGIEITVDYFYVNDYQDDLTVNGNVYNGGTEYKGGTTTQSSITWTSDQGATGKGWKICAEAAPPTQTPTVAPTQAPTQQPTEAPTDAPTEAPTEAPTTQTPTAAPTTAAPTAVSAIVSASASGDPHMINVVGEEFDIAKAGHSGSFGVVR